MRSRLLPAAIVATLVYVYLAGILSYPLKWEEPRRCLVAMEMIHSGDFIGPRVLGEPYFKKPPLQNWLLAVAAQLEVAKVGPARIRVISLLALVGIALFLFRLGSDGRRGRSDPLPAAIFLTLGAVIQSGRTGEIDSLFTFFVVGALGCFELGRRRGSPWLQWFVPHLFLAAGILTKILAPLFFYPPLLYLALRRRGRVRFSSRPFVAGFAAMAGLVALWLVPHSRLQDSSALVGGWSMEVAVRTLHYGAAGWLRHLATYPFQILGWLLPWSLVLIPMRRDAWRSTFDAWRRDPFLGLCAAVVAWAFVVYLFVPEQKGRYLLPVMPFVSILVAQRVRQLSVPATTWRRRGLGLAVIVWIGLCVAVGPRVVGETAPILVPLSFGLLALGAFLAAEALSPPARRGSLLLLLGLVYGVSYAGFLERREARRNAVFVEDARKLSAFIDSGDSVVCHGGVHLKFCANLTRELGRPLVRRAEPIDSKVWIAPVGSNPDVPGPTVHAERYELFRIRGEQGWSTDGTPLFPVALDEATRGGFETELAAARADFEASPEDADAAIWFGRRTAYLGRYREAIAIYDRALDRHPEDARILRHRGHRFISLRRFESAVNDLEAAAALIDGLPDQVEPDGLPNSRNIPTSTLHSNVWYHLGLSYYLKGDLDNAERAYRRCLEFSANPDMLSATSHWLYMTLRRRGMHDEAEAILDPIHAGMEILENHSYHRLLLMYKSELDPETLLAEGEGEGSLDAALGYGIANWYLVQGQRDRAMALMAEIRAAGPWPAFGAIAAEVDLARLSNRTL